MNTRALTYAVIGFSFLALMLQSLGCSAIGFWVGATKDSNTRLVEVAPSSYVDLEPGTEIAILLRDSTEVTGTFSAQGRLADEQYAKRYDGWRVNQRGETAMPQIGDELFLLRSSPTENGVSGYLVGFDPDYIHVRSHKGNMELNFWNPAVDHVYNNRGQTIDMRGILRRMERGNIPYMSYIRIIREGVMTQIPCERIRELHMSRTTNWKWVGLAAGLAVDCTAFLLLRSLARHYDFSDFHL